MINRIIGIDPGLSGGVAVIDASTKEAQAWPMPTHPDTGTVDERALWNILIEYPRKETAVWVEKAQAAPRQGVVSMFNYGVGFGIVLATTRLLYGDVRLVRPTVWKKTLGLSGQPGKESTILFVEQRYPDVNLVRPRCRKPHDGMADAICIAHYGLMQLIHP